MAAPVPEPDDAALVGRARGGDTGAFEALVARHQRAVFATACAVLGDTSGAEDIAQETFLVAWRTLARLLAPSQVRPWLTGIARHLAVSEIRRRGRAAAPLPELPEPGAPDPLEGRIAAEATAADVAGLRAALAALSDRQREVVTLRYFGDLSYRDIAETLGLTLDVVQVTLFRAKQALGRNLRKIRGPQAT